MTTYEHDAEDELADLRAEFELRRFFRCSDGYCGGTDCARCYPDIELQEEEESET